MSYKIQVRKLDTGERKKFKATIGNKIDVITVVKNAFPEDERASKLLGSKVTVDFVYNNLENLCKFKNTITYGNVEISVINAPMFEVGDFVRVNNTDNSLVYRIVTVNTTENCVTAVPFYRYYNHDFFETNVISIDKLVLFAKPGEAVDKFIDWINNVI